MIITKSIIALLTTAIVGITVRPIVADVAFTTESMVVVSALMAALAGAVALLFRQLISAKDAQLVAANSRADSYSEMAQEAINHLEDAANAKLQLAGKPIPNPLPPVVPEHSSPTTVKQQQSADLQTMRAQLTSATFNLGLPARRASRLETAEEAAKNKSA